MDRTWLLLGGGATVAAAARIAYMEHYATQLEREAPAQRRHRGDTETDFGEMAAALMPSRPALLIAGCTAAPAVGYFAQATAAATAYAAMMAAAAYAAGHAVDHCLGTAGTAETTDAGDSPSNHNDAGGAFMVGASEASTAVAVFFGSATPGGLVKGTGYSLASLWLTTRVTGQLASLFLVCSIGLAPAVVEVRTTWQREGRWLRTASAEWVGDTTRDVFAVGLDELSEAWDAHGLGPTATYAEAFQMLTHHGDQRIRKFSAELAARVDRVPGVPTAVAAAAERALVGLATVVLHRMLLHPQKMMEVNPALAERQMTKRTCVHYLNECGVNVSNTLRYAILGNVSVMELMSP
mmetsp:Transcript_9029/g.27330  ORF Transcript_9029/g.27330 Transcript_9029/m.27330 type:complete len:352 (+) Transcript_9029:72-1127(+)